MADNEVGAIITMLQKRYKVPRILIDKLRIAFASEGVVNGRSMQYDRIMTAVALMMVRCFGFGAGRVIKGLREFDAIAGSVDKEGGPSWPDLMEELDQKTGIIVQDNPDRFVAEYRGRYWRRQLEVIEAEKKLDAEKKAKEDSENDS